MKMDQHTYAAIVRLEESLWRMETRYDEALMKQTFADDFFEFGQSGRVFTLSDILLSGGKPEFSAVLPLENLTARHLATRVIQVTYISEVTIHNQTTRANRSSIWRAEGDQWRLTFHQGTRVAT